MTVNEHKEKNSIILLLSGKITGIESILFSKQIEKYRNADCDRIILDLSAVTFFDSGAIGSFIYLNTIMRKAGHEILFRGLNEQLQELFRNFSLDHFFKFESV